MTQLRLRSSSFYEHGSNFGVFGFHECGSGALFSHGSDSSCGFCLFLHIKILIVLMCLTLMENELNQVHKTKRIYWYNIPGMAQLRLFDLSEKLCICCFFYFYCKV